MPSKKIQEVSRSSGLFVEDINTKLMSGQWITCQCGYPTAKVDMVDRNGVEMCEGCADDYDNAHTEPVELF